MTTVTAVTSTVNPALIVKEKTVKPFLFSVDSSSAGRDDPNAGMFSDLTGSDFLVGGIRTVINLESNLQKTYFFTSVHGIEHDQLFIEFNIGAARQMSLSAEVRMRVEYNVKERRRLKSVIEKKDKLLKVKEREIEDLKAQLLMREAEAAEAIRLRAEASNFEAVEKSLRDETNALRERNVILKKERNALSQNDNLVDLVHELEVSSSGLQEKVTLYTDFVEMALHLEEKFYPHLLITIFGRRWLLTQGMELAITKCLHSPEYLSDLEATISKAIEKGMHDGLAAGITHGKEGRVLTDVAAYNPSAEVDYILTLQRLQNVNFPLLGELRSNKVVIGATALSLALDVSSAEGTSDTVPATTDTTTALSITFASASTIAHIFVDDYEVVGTDDQADIDGNAEPFPSVDDAELNIP
ncbi:hypothetical protein Tco_1254022 [Tanacetum coccineum]